MNPNPSKEEQEIIQPSIEELTARNRELERRIAEKTEELQIAKEEAEAANEAKSIFLSTVSHELRTPLTSIIGFTKLNKKSLDAKVIPGLNEDNRKAIKSANRISENLEVVKSEGERLLNIINDLLDLAKIESGKVEWKIQPADPNQLIERASLAVASLFEEKPTIELVKKKLPDAPTIAVDRDRMLQVLINLLSNAIKFTEEGQITLSVEYLPFPIISGASKHKKHLVFRVEDTGPGIPASHIDKIFDRFQQVGDHHTDKPQGTGLGLAICKEIVEHHKGKIWVESEVGKGSIFAFIVPY
jgi:signal transduction histidine kinase